MRHWNSKHGRQRGMISIFALAAITALLNLAVAQYNYARLSVRAGHAHWEAVYKNRVILNSLPLVRAEGSPGSDALIYLDESIAYRWERDGNELLRAERIVTRFEKTHDQWPSMTGIWIEAEGFQFFVRDAGRM